jgi:NO-binding membrane sensor protein with MHYT domain
MDSNQIIYNEVNYNFFLVFLSYIIAVFGSYTSLVFARESLNVTPKERFAWIAWASIIMGSVGVWSMHFVGMMAFDMGMPVNYDIGLTIISMILVILGCAIGFGVVGLGSRNLLVMFLAAVFMGGGIAAMHYMGMAAMNMTANVEWNYTFVVLSLLVALFASVAALWMAFNLHTNIQMALASLVAGLAVCGVHYVGMFAYNFTTMSHVHNENPLASALSPTVVGSGLFVLSLVVLLIGVALTRARPFSTANNQAMPEGANA